MTKTSDILTGIITSDFQFQFPWGFFRLENKYWEKSNWNQLIYPNMIVDINHNRKPSAYLFDMQEVICNSYKRKLFEFEEPKPMVAIIASFLIPFDSQCKTFIDNSIKKGKIGVSIEQYVKKRKRFIGHRVTLCNDPFNKDAWIIKATISGKNYENVYPKQLPKEAMEIATSQHLKMQNLCTNYVKI